MPIATFVAQTAFRSVGMGPAVIYVGLLLKVHRFAGKARRRQSIQNTCISSIYLER
jgi:hypothetical protein